jgi:FMN phosphatase YigB (HAD superfamily)
MHCCAALGAFKSELAFYRAVEERAGLAAEQHCLIDDRLENVETAGHAGWQGFLWTPSSQLADVLRTITWQQLYRGATQSGRVGSFRTL